MIMPELHQQTASGNEHDSSLQVKDSPQCLSRVRLLFLQSFLDDSIAYQDYVDTGTGTINDPYLVEYLHNDHHDAMNFSKRRKWTIAVLHSLATFAVTFASSVYANGIPDIAHYFHVSTEVATLGLSLFVLGFAVGPLLWAPLSEIYGRKIAFLVSYTTYMVFSLAAMCAPNATALLIFRFLASACGSSTMTNTGGIIADMFNKEERGLATVLFSMAPFLGPALGPIAGGFLAEGLDWRWILRVTAILGVVIGIPTMLATRETYAPFILRSRAKALSQMTNKVYLSRTDAKNPPKTLLRELGLSLTRPWALLFLEPIVLLTSLYISIIYGTLYMFFAGFPIIFQETRGWSQGIAGLPFIGVAIGVCLATLATGVGNKYYVRMCATAEAEGRPIEPEARLGAAMVGAVILPVSLFLFAWTTYPSVHWIVPIIGAMFFACGLVMVFISLISYLIDSYSIYAASVLAANSVLRSLFGTAFPLFTTRMYQSLGNQWASSIPAFLVLGCLPFPFLFYKYGHRIRSRCKYASEAATIGNMMRRRNLAATSGASNVTKEKVVK